MAGFPLFGDGFTLADRVTSVFSSLGALVAPLGISHAWTKLQYQAPVAWTLAAGDIDYVATASTIYSYDLDSGAAEVQLPTLLAAGMAWRAFVTADGSNNLTWVSNYDWGESGAPDLSALSDSEFKVLDFVAQSATVIACAASETYGS